MKTAFHKLGTNDAKARALFLDSLEICAHDHVLSRKLLERYSSAGGPMFAIIGDWFDLTQMENYNYTIRAPIGSLKYSPGDFPQDHLVKFVRGYLQEDSRNIVLCENWGWKRKHIAFQPWPPPQLACFGDEEVYHILTPDVTDEDQIKAAVIDRHHWQTNVCSHCDSVPEGDIPDEAFFDEIVQNTKHIFIPAFDGSGYLIWSPSEV